MWILDGKCSDSLLHLNHLNDLKCKFNDTQIRNLINRKPTLLSFSVERRLEPKIRGLRSLGMSETDLAKLIVSNPTVLEARVNHILHSIDFLRTHLHSDENIVKVLKKSYWLLFFDIRKLMLPNVLFLQSCGVSNNWISKLILKNPRLITQKPGWLEEIVERVENFGITRGSGMFVHAFLAISSVSKSTLEAKFQVFKSYGWSETNILSAFHIAPYLVMFSECKIRKVMDFLNDKLEYEPLYVALHPILFMHSLEKRLIPRYNVLQILKSKRLIHRNPNFCSVAKIPEKKFLQVYVIPHMNEVPDIHETYMASQGNALPINC